MASNFAFALRQPRLAVRLQFIAASALLCLLALGGFAVVDRYDLTWSTRAEKLRSITEAAVSIAAGLESEVKAGKLARAQAIKQFRDIVRPVRFDDGAGYYFVYANDGETLVLGPTPNVEGTNRLGFPDADGRLFVKELMTAASQGGGTVVYRYPKPGSPEPLPKMSYAAAFAPWNLFVGTGLYIDDLQAAAWSDTMRLGSVIAIAIVGTMLIAWLVSRSITRPLEQLRRHMAVLADGDTAKAIGGTDRRDELGDMARTLLVFQEHMVKEAELTAAQVAERKQAAQERRAALSAMADTIEADSATALHQIAAGTAAMTATVTAMSESADRTGASAQNAAGAASQALANAQTVASAAEQLAASIREIGSQVDQSNAVVDRAVAAGQDTRTTIGTLNREVEQIGAVADMIGEIAARTNLLALNATIEAARAGEAGKGFAVVASEVKQLASQTARSTEEIGRHIAQVRTATQASVTAVERIERTIGEINAIAGSIAAAVEQQGAATGEIARSVTETASAATAMTSRTEELSVEARQTRQQANDVLGNAKALDDAVVELRHSVIRIVRTSTTEVDRRRHRRHAVEVPCRVTPAGGSTHQARLADISEGGAALTGGPALAVGAEGTLDVEGTGLPLRFTVRSVDPRGGVHVAFAPDRTTAARLPSLIEGMARRYAVSA